MYVRHVSLKIECQATLEQKTTKLDIPFWWWWFPTFWCQILTFKSFTVRVFSLMLLKVIQVKWTTVAHHQIKESRWNWVCTKGALDLEWDCLSFSTLITLPWAWRPWRTSISSISLMTKRMPTGTILVIHWPFLLWHAIVYSLWENRLFFQCYSQSL